MNDMKSCISELNAHTSKSLDMRFCWSNLLLKLVSIARFISVHRLWNKGTLRARLPCTVPVLLSVYRQV